VVLFNAGRDPKNKRLDLAMESVKVAQRVWPDLRLEVLNGQVDPEQVPVLLNASDCLLVTSDTEGSPTVIQEALACAVPIISVDVGDAVERLRGVTHTRIVERVAERIGRALAGITATPLRTNGPEMVRATGLDRTTRRLLGLYCETLGESARPLAAAALRGR
jgi:glycosyltransferase involved in cell wall biosynthesis